MYGVLKLNRHVMYFFFLATSGCLLGVKKEGIREARKVQSDEGRDLKYRLIRDERLQRKEAEEKQTDGHAGGFRVALFKKSRVQHQA